MNRRRGRNRKENGCALGTRSWTFSAPPSGTRGGLTGTANRWRLTKLGQRGYVAHEVYGTYRTGGTTPTPREDHDRQQTHPFNVATAPCMVGDVRPTPMTNLDRQTRFMAVREDSLVAACRATNRDTALTKETDEWQAFDDGVTE